ncbi:Uncharacterised protein [Bordetella pertussis]|nr:Uncharacterised protein [Bordetella pertussis]
MGSMRKARSASTSMLSSAGLRAEASSPISTAPGYSLPRRAAIWRSASSSAMVTRSRGELLPRTASSVRWRKRGRTSERAASASRAAMRRVSSRENVRFMEWGNNVRPANLAWAGAPAYDKNGRGLAPGCAASG